MTIERTAPLTFSQESLWFFYQMEPGSRVYNLGLFFKLNGKLDIQAFEKSLNRVVARHEPLRTTISGQGDAPLQAIHAFESFTLKLTEMPGIPTGERLARAETLLRQRLDVAFDLVNGSAWQMELLRFSAEEHYFLFPIHHIVFDGFSLDLFIQDLLFAYEALIGGAEPAFAPLPLTYGDFAVLQRASDEKIDHSLEEWLARLGADFSPLDLPTDQPRPSTPKQDAGIVYRNFDAGFVQKMDALARETGTTTFSILMSAFGELLHRYTGQERVIVGCPFANRGTPETRKTFGFFVNTMPIRIDIKPGMTFIELIKQTREFTLFAIENQFMPFEKLVKALNPPRSLGIHPIFQVVINKVPITYERNAAAGLEIENLIYNSPRSPFDMELRFNPQEDGSLVVTWKHNLELFNAQTIQRMAVHFETLLHRAVDSPNSPVASFEMLSALERERLIYGQNATRADLPASFVHESIFFQAEATPNALAVSDETHTWTYRELVTRSQQITRALLAAGAVPQTRIGILLERSVELPAALLAVMLIGATYVPLDPIYPPERIKAIVEDSAAGIIISQETVWARNVVLGIRPLLLDSLPDAENLPIPYLRPAPDDLVYLIYTSGSTGIPKGVGITYQNLAVHLDAMQKIVQMNPQDSLLAVTTITFDISNLEILLPLMHGAQLFIASTEKTHSGDALIQKMEQFRPAWMQATPATWKMLIAAGWQGAKGMSILCGGETLDAGLARQLFGCARAVWNVYGPTEATIWATAYRVLGDEKIEIPIGRPLQNYRAYILDGNMEVVLPGTRGMLYIAGQGVAWGYQNRPEQTAAAFLPDPFFPGERMYRTGDLASFLPDGNILFHGRNDFQVKIRGFRIELGEIEAALKQHPAVRDAVVVAQEHASGKRLAAFWLGTDNAAPDLRGFLQSKLPDYMLPAVFEKLPQFPLNSSGKLDRKSLSHRQIEVLMSGYVAPQGEIEIKLVEIWQDIMGLENIGVTDSFFDLGGHSLMATRLLSKIEQQFGQKLTLASLFEYSTIRRQAQLISKKIIVPGSDTIICIQPQGEKDPLFIIAPLGAHGTLYMRDLALNFAPDQPVYSLWVKFGAQEKVKTLFEAASIAASEIRKAFPGKPYYLLGHSSGGLIAFEIAQILMQYGEKIGLLGLLDTYPLIPELIEPRRHNLTWLQRFNIHISRLRSLNLTGIFNYPLDRLRVRLAAFLPRLIQLMPGRQFIARAILPVVSSESAARIAIGVHEIKPYPGKLHVFRAESSRTPEIRALMQEWEHFVHGGLEIVDIPGDHVSFLKNPDAIPTAEIIRRYLP
jgi:amino acid adenylation domain-containing protein